MSVGQRVAVVGLGRSGLAAAELCVALGHRVTAVDRRELSALGPRAESLHRGALHPEAARGPGGSSVSDRLPVRFEVGDPTVALLVAHDLVVVSPGIPPSAALDEAARRGVPVIGETELAARHLTAPLAAVGGTNGKSTVTTLLGEMARAAGVSAFVGGNLGTPACEAVADPWELVVLEVSSFQMERVDVFHPRVCSLLNVTDDHLDRYPSFDAYADAKGNSFLRQTPDDTAVIPAGDALCLRQARRGQGRVLTFGPGGELATLEGRVERRADGRTFSLADTKLRGAHNAQNAAAAVAMAMAAGLPDAAIAAGLRRFEPLGHRMALVADHQGIRFYDDSKATNVGAAVSALRGLDEARGVLIAGGRDKQGSYAPLRDALVDRGRALVLLGEASDLIADAVGGAVPVQRAETMEEAVRRAFALAQPGDAVLLSPACSSFDRYRSYAERGDDFQAAVRALVGQPGAAGPREDHS